MRYPQGDSSTLRMLRQPSMIKLSSVKARGQLCDGCPAPKTRRGVAEMATHTRTRWKTLVLSFGLLVLTGCGHLRLYSPGLDEQGQKAQKAWKDVDLSGVVQAERERSAALLKAEASYRETSTLASRDLRLFGIATSPSLEKSLKVPTRV